MNVGVIILVLTFIWINYLLNYGKEVTTYGEYCSSAFTRDPTRLDLGNSSTYGSYPVVGYNLTLVQDNAFEQLLAHGPFNIATKSSFTLVPGLMNPCVWPDNCSLLASHCLSQLRCLPYFILIGVEKSGTSYLYYGLLQHPNIHGAVRKEPHFFDDTGPANSLHLIHHGTLDGYTKMFDNHTHIRATGTHAIRQCLSSQPPGLCPDIITDFTPRLFTASQNWKEEWFNQALEQPLITVRHKMRLLLPRVKLIMILRNPTQRLFSSYRFFLDHMGLERSVEDFNKRALGQIESWKRCVATFSYSACLFGAPPESSGFGLFWDVNSYDQLRMGCYSLYIKEWLRVFPRKQFLFLNFDVFKMSVTKNIEDLMLPFLGVAPYPDGVREGMLKRDRHAEEEKTDSRHGNLSAMLPATQSALDSFYRPFNEELALFLNDSSYLWYW